MDKFEAKEKYFMDKMNNKEKKYFEDCKKKFSNNVTEECCYKPDYEETCYEEPCCKEPYIVTSPPITNNNRSDIRRNNNNNNKTISNCGGNVNIYTKTAPASTGQSTGIPVNVSFNPNATSSAPISQTSGAVPFDPALASTYKAGTLVTYNCEVYVVNRSSPCGVPGKSADYTKLSNNSSCNTCCNTSECETNAYPFSMGTSYGYGVDSFCDESCLTSDDENCSCCAPSESRGFFVECYNPSKTNRYVRGQIISYNGELYRVNRNNPCGVPGASKDYTKITGNFEKNCEAVIGYFFNRTDLGLTIDTGVIAPLKEAANNNTKGCFTLTSPGSITILKDGIYKIQYTVLLANATISTFALFRNGILIEGSEGSTASTSILGNTLVKLNTNDVISIRNIGNSVTLSNKLNNVIPTVVSLTIEKVAKNCKC